MNKIFTIAKRDYLAAVKTKAFLISLILFPILMGIGAIGPMIGKQVKDTATYKVAVLDRTPGKQLLDDVQSAVKSHNEKVTGENGKTSGPTFEVQEVEPANVDNKDDLEAQRLELSNLVKSDELLAFVEIGRDVLQPEFDLDAIQSMQSKIDPDDMLETASVADSAVGDQNAIRYASNKPTYGAFRDLLNDSLNQMVVLQRVMSLGIGQDQYAQLQSALLAPKVLNRGLTKQAADGTIEDSNRNEQIVSIVVPLALLMLMFLIVIVGTSPMTTNVVEEKQLRIAEVLLGGATPFQLMLGKVLGGVGVALTLGMIYLVGAAVVMNNFGLLQHISIGLISLFLLFTVLAAMMFGSLFTAAGAAVTNVKEAQSVITPVMLVLVLPMVLLQPIMENPTGPLAKAMTFFPFATPMVAVMRAGIPPGMEPWEIIAAIIWCLITTVVVVWAAGRIFRIGYLLSGKAAKPLEMLGWVIRG